MSVTLDSETVEAIAQRVAELISPAEPSSRCLTAAQVAERFGVSRDWVYDRAAELGAIPLGDGPRPRLLFDAEKVAEAFTPRPFTPPPPPERRRPNQKPASVELLPVRGER